MATPSPERGAPVLARLEPAALAAAVGAVRHAERAALAGELRSVNDALLAASREAPADTLRIYVGGSPSAPGVLGFVGPDIKARR